MKTSAYKKLGLSILLSFIAMYAVMFLNVAEADHVYISMPRFYMTLLMICPMVVIMVTIMWGMYDNKPFNTFLLTASVLVFIVALAGLRSQAMIGDVQYMRGMISHHSSAIMTSSQAKIEDPEVKALSQSIIHSQQKEIAQMKAMLARIRADHENKRSH